MPAANLRLKSSGARLYLFNFRPNWIKEAANFEKLLIIIFIEFINCFDLKPLSLFKTARRMIFAKNSPISAFGLYPQSGSCYNAFSSFAKRLFRNFWSNVNRQTKIQSKRPVNYMLSAVNTFLEIYFIYRNRQLSPYNIDAHIMHVIRLYRYLLSLYEM